MAMAAPAAQTRKPLYVDQHASASVLVGEFRNAAALLALPDAQQFQFLHQSVYVTLDELVGRHKVYKLFGSSFGFMLATNVAEPDPDHAATLLACARELLEQLQQVRLPCGAPLEPVVALSTGAITSGLLGTVSLTYQLVGRAVSVARELSKMQGSLPFVATQAFWDALPDEAAAELAPIGRVPLVAADGRQEQLFTLLAYSNAAAALVQSSTWEAAAAEGAGAEDAGAEAPAEVPSPPDAEEGSVPGSSSDDASDAPSSSRQPGVASGEDDSLELSAELA